MSDERFTIKPQDDYWAVVDNYNEDKVCIINGIHTKIEAIWLCDFMNDQQAEINDLNQENEQLKNELRKEKSLREYSDSMYDADLIVNIRFSNGEWKADVSVIDDE